VADAIWNARDPEHVRHFAAFLKPMQRASGTRRLDDELVALETVQAWILTLAEVPADVLEEARRRVLAEGITWMPRPGDLKRHCAAIVEERRRAYYAGAASRIAECPRCFGSTWTEVEIDGVAHSVRCGCFVSVIALEANAPKAIALPAAPDDDEAR
jgi:hypothetical protein